MVLYEAKDLKKQFKELEELNDFTLIPLFDRVADGFWNYLNQNPPKYGISDGRRMPVQSGEGLWGYVNDSYILVVDGKIVSLSIHRDDIDASDDDEFWWMADRIEFGYNEEGAMKILNGAKNFVNKQNLNDLLKEAKEELEKGKTHHLSSQMKWFYFHRGF